MKNASHFCDAEKVFFFEQNKRFKESIKNKG